MGFFDFFREKSVAELSAKRDIRGLARALGRMDPTSRAQAANALGVIGDPSAVHPLIERLRDPDSSVRRDISAALSRLLPACGAGPFVDHLRHPDATTREEISRILGAAGWKPSDDSETVAFLLACRAREQLRNLSYRALLNSMTLPNKSSWSNAYSEFFLVHVFAALCSNPSPDPEFVLAQLNNTQNDSAVRSFCASLAGLCPGPELIRSLAEILRSPGAPATLRANCALALQLRAELAVGEALSLLRDPALDDNIRLAHVSRILAYAGKPAVAGTLEELRRRGRKADFASVFALLGTGEADALDGLRSALPLFEASDRQGIQTFLSYFDRKSAASVANLLSNGSAAIRIIACSVLGNLRHRESVDNLYRLAASDSNESVRTEALFALGKMTDNKEAHQSLELLLNRDDVGVRMGAILLLSKAGIPVLGKLHAPA